jgi:hypothetical protein
MAAAAPGEERRGIPAAAFVEDVETYLSQSGLNVSASLSLLQERLQQYKLVEMKLLAQQRDLQACNTSAKRSLCQCIYLSYSYPFLLTFSSLFSRPKFLT